METKTNIRHLITVTFFLLSWQILNSLSFPIESTTRRGAIQTTIAAVSLRDSSRKTDINMRKDKKSISWGIVGLGDVCKKKSGPPFYKCDGSDLVAVMRRTPGKAKEFAAQVPGGDCVGYENLDEFLKHPGMDAVYVSTRPGTHLDICRQVALAGKACYVEKPVGRCAEETEMITRMFQNAGLPLYTAYISRAYDKTQAIRNLICSGELGDKIKKVTYTCIGSGGARDIDGPLPWRLDSEQSGGGLIMDVGCHVLDRIDYLFGSLTDIKGEAENKNSPHIEVEDFVHFTAQTSSSDWSAISSNEGCFVECTWDFGSSKDPYDELQIIGTKASLKMAGGPADPIKIYDETGTYLRTLEFEMPEHTGESLIQAVTNDLRNLDKSDYLSYGDNAIRTQRVLDEVLKSYYDGREIGFWTRTKTWPGNPNKI